MAEYDGAVRLNTHIDTKGIVTGEKEIEKHLNLLKIDAEEYAKTLKELEAQGKFFGDEDYDKVYLAWKNATNAVKEYRAELDQQSAKVQEVLQEEQAEQNRLAEIKKNATVSDDKMVSLLEQEKALTQELKELKAAGVTEGYQEYDKTYIALENAKNAVKEYRTELEKQTESGQAKAAEEAAKALEKQEAAQRKIEEQAERNLQKENAKIQKEAENAAKLQAKEAERQAKLEQEAAEEQRLAQIRESAVVGNQRIVEAMERRKQLAQKIADMEKAGVGRGYKQYDSAKQELTALDQEIKNYSNDVDKVKKKYAKLGEAAKKAFSAAHSAISKAGDGVKSLGTVAKRAFSKIIKPAKESNGLLSTMKSRFKGLAMSLLIFNQISKAFNAMISAAKEGFGNLYDDVSSFKASADSLKASALTLKNSFAAAFRPLVDIAIPYIQKVVDYMTQLLDVVGQFMAAITGQKTYTKAIKQTTAALEDEEEAQNKQLSGLDKLNNLSSGSSADADVGTGKMFEEVPIENSIGDFADRISEAFSRIFDVFKEAWESKGKSVINSAKKVLEKLKGAVESVGKSFNEVFTGGAGLEWVESLIDRLNSILGIIHSVADAFAKAWDGGTGKENLTALFDMMTDVNGLLTSIRKSFSRVFGSGIGVKIFENVLGIFTGIYKTIENIAEGIQTAWDTAGLGDSIWSGILNIINTILGTIHSIVDSTAEWAKNIDFTPLLTSIDGLLQALEPLTENIGEGLEWFWNNVLLPIAGWVIQDAVPAFLDMLSAAIGALNAVIETLKPLGTWLWEKLLLPLGEWTGNLIISAMETLTNLLDAFTGLLSDNQDAADNCAGIIDVLSGAWNGLIEILTPFAEFLSAVFSSVWNDMLSPALEYLGETILPTVISTFENLWNNVLAPFGEFLKNILKPAISAISYILKKLWEKVVVPLAKAVGGVFSKAFETIAKIFNTVVVPAVGAVKDVLNFLWNEIFKPVADFLEDTLGPVFETVFGAIEKVISSFQGILEGVIETIGEAFGWIAEKVDWVLEKLGLVEKESVGLHTGGAFAKSGSGNVGADIGAGSLRSSSAIATLSHMDIPGYATGQVIPRTMKQHLAILGDNTRETEVVSPLSTIKQALREEALSLGLANNGAEGGVIELHLTVECEGYKLLKLIQKLDREQVKATGRPSFQI